MLLCRRSSVGSSCFFLAGTARQLHLITRGRADLEGQEQLDDVACGAIVQRPEHCDMPRVLCIGRATEASAE